MGLSQIDSLKHSDFKSSTSFLMVSLFKINKHAENLSNLDPLLRECTKLERDFTLALIIIDTLHNQLSAEAINEMKARLQPIKETITNKSLRAATLQGLADLEQKVVNLNIQSEKFLGLWKNAHGRFDTQAKEIMSAIHNKNEAILGGLVATLPKYKKELEEGIMASTPQYQEILNEAMQSYQKTLADVNKLTGRVESALSGPGLSIK